MFADFYINLRGMHAEKKHHKPICMARILPATPKVPVNLNIRNLANTCVSKDLNYSSLKSARDLYRFTQPPTICQLYPT
jgi:hypothetical protein